MLGPPPEGFPHEPSRRTPGSTSPRLIRPVRVDPGPRRPDGKEWKI